MLAVIDHTLPGPADLFLLCFELFQCMILCDGVEVGTEVDEVRFLPQSDLSKEDRLVTHTQERNT